ncbi:hypothetical protein pb186bvf_001412 [Paramecium bursaria]
MSQEFDLELMSNEVGFTLDILMELAGQAIANTVFKLDTNKSIKNILVLCGPGNNGGDGIVAARHLKMLGYNSEIVLFREIKQPFFLRLIQTCKYNNIQIHNGIEDFSFYNKYDLLVDSLLGFSFVPPLREPFTQAIHAYKTTKTPILSVDIPSGWDVEQGNTLDLFTPQYLISLTLPKLGTFFGRKICTIKTIREIWIYNSSIQWY